MKASNILPIYSSIIFFLPGCTQIGQHSPSNLIGSLQSVTGHWMVSQSTTFCRVPSPTGEAATHESKGKKQHIKNGMLGNISGIGDLFDVGSSDQMLATFYGKKVALYTPSPSPHPPSPSPLKEVSKQHWYACYAQTPLT